MSAVPESASSTLRSLGINTLKLPSPLKFEDSHILAHVVSFCPLTHHTLRLAASFCRSASTIYPFSSHTSTSTHSSIMPPSKAFAASSMTFPPSSALSSIATSTAPCCGATTADCTCPASIPARDGYGAGQGSAPGDQGYRATSVRLQLASFKTICTRIETNQHSRSTYTHTTSPPGVQHLSVTLTLSPAQIHQPLPALLLKLPLLLALPHKSLTVSIACVN